MRVTWSIENEASREGGMQNENRNSKKREGGEEKRLETAEFVYYSDTTTTGSMFAQFLSPATRRKYYWMVANFVSSRGKRAVQRVGSEGGALSREPKLSKSAKLLLLVVGFGLRVAHSFMAHLLVNLNFTHTHMYIYIYTHTRAHIKVKFSSLAPSLPFPNIIFSTFGPSVLPRSVQMIYVHFYVGFGRLRRTRVLPTVHIVSCNNRTFSCSLLQVN